MATLLTRQAKIKRVKLSEFEDVRPSGIIAMNLGPGDELGWARHGGGRGIHHRHRGRPRTALRRDRGPDGRSAAGVGAINLNEGDGVACFDVVEPGGDLLVITQNGYGKRTPLTEYPAHSRKTGGQWTLSHTRLDETGKIVAARVVEEDDQVTLITSNGIALRTPVNAISQMSRMTRGVRIVNPDSGDTIAAMARLAASVAASGDEGQNATQAGGAKVEMRAEDVAEELEIAAEGENGNGEAVEVELAALGDVEFDATR